MVETGRGRPAESERTERALGEFYDRADFDGQAPADPTEKRFGAFSDYARLHRAIQ
jgi:hypothetical protein